jgi:hypothetical protein
MSTKKMLNSVETAVDEMLAGAVASNPGLVKLENHRVVLRSGKWQVVPRGIPCPGFKKTGINLTEKCYAI